MFLCSVMRERFRNKNNILQENASLRASYKTEVAAVELNMQEVLLQFQSKVSRLEKDKENCLESPAKADKVNRALHAENVGLTSKLKVLTSSNEEQSVEINVLQNNLHQAQSELTNLQSGLKMRLKQSFLS